MSNTLFCQLKLYPLRNAPQGFIEIFFIPCENAMNIYILNFSKNPGTASYFKRL
jgi:hypothetical protein